MLLPLLVVSLPMLMIIVFAVVVAAVLSVMMEQSPGTPEDASLLQDHQTELRSNQRGTNATPQSEAEKGILA